MADLGGFNANEVEPNKDFEAIPPGRYEAMIMESEMKPTSSGNGEYLELTMTVLGPTCKGATLWDRLNLKNPSEKAVQIARGQLSSLCRAVGVLTPRDSTQLHNLPFIVRVDVEDYEGKKYNRMKGYYAKEAPAAQTPAKEAAAVPSGGGSAPWPKKK